MIMKGHLGKEQIKWFSIAEAKAFAIFLIKERARHSKDIDEIDETLAMVFEEFEFNDKELHPFYWYDRDKGLEDTN